MRGITFQKLRDIDPIEDLFFKRRTLFGIDLDNYNEQAIENAEYIVNGYSGRIDPTQLDRNELRSLYEKIGERRVDNRLKRADCSLFLAREKDAKNGDLAGFYWSVAPEGDVVWHDNFKVESSEALVFNGFVYPKYRRSGVYRLLQSATHNHVFYKKDVDFVYTIVENRNTASMSANKEFGLKKVAVNYLVKFLSINILSIFKSECRVIVHYVINKKNL
jgi:hypothetical protein